MSHSHDHNHDHSGHHHPVPHSFNKAFGIAILLNFAFTIFQATYAIIANSMGLLADAAHNFGDVFGLVLAWGASWLLTLPPNKRYSYGFKRTTIMAALTNALILVASSALIAYESIYKFWHLSQVNERIVIIVALIGIIINGSTAMLFMKGAHHDLNIKGAFLHLLGDAFISIGVVVSGILILFTRQMWIDPLVGLLIIVVILWGTWGLLRDSTRLILDAIPRHIDRQGVETYFKNISGVQTVHDLHIWGLSTKEVAMTIHLIMPANPLSDEDFIKINRDLKNQFRIDHVTIQVEKGSSEFPCQQIEVC
ncbi:MAG TPA: cation diffusion facilitator family transporter [Gammaproteobacteria bacterium]|nr:cation diffusion facilitator family transporter [Gammaproteobacteria bacterium]